MKTVLLKDAYEMKKIANDIRIMIKVCDLYYNQNMKHQQIADILNISRPTVSKILSSAVEQKIVSIDIYNLDTVKYWDLEQQLKKKLDLNDIVIVDTTENDAELKAMLGNAAAKYLEHTVKDGDSIGISMGSTLYHIAQYPFEHTQNNITFVPLIGGMGNLRTELHSNHLAEKLTKVYGGTFVPLYAPARVSNASVRRELVKEPSVASVLSLQKNLSISVVGIGYPNENSSIKATGYYKTNEIQSLIERGVSGEICMQFYDIQGNTSQYKNDNNIIGLDINRLKKIPCSIGVAGGIDKLTAIKGAIKGKYINTLITDYSCAEALLYD